MNIKAPSDFVRYRQPSLQHRCVYFFITYLTVIDLTMVGKV